MHTGSTSESVSSDRNEEPVQKKHRSNKNPDVDTSFLPDRDREEEENKLREELRQVLHLWSIILLVSWLNLKISQEWVKKQEALKQEPIEITYRLNHLWVSKMRFLKIYF